ncbi:uncharacterized protein LOC113757863 [Coffea eugenioides]|uniref:uncharacterized protein LOC113757863 n=1 Tax=Coffea eugenioides TaxID=49369 RepID=UPI000F6071A3|nr:uncharacterized protein LOC113757863 [Coffea eugenioides]
MDGGRKWSFHGINTYPVDGVSSRGDIRSSLATNVDDFKRALNALEIAQPQNGENLTAAGWLKRLPYHLWSRAHYGIAAKTDFSVNNLNESFNNYILKARDEPIRQGVEKYGGRLCPNILEKLAKSVEKSRHCIAVFDGIESFEVDGFNRTSVVNLQRRSCSCGAFQLTGIPCVHAIAAIPNMGMKVENYVDECYSKKAYLRAYAYSIGAIPSKEHWIDSGMQLLNPPFVKKQPGRTKKLRRRGPDESRDPQRASKKGLTVYCKRCLKADHNRRTCKEPPYPKSKLYKKHRDHSYLRSVKPPPKFAEVDMATSI